MPRSAVTTELVTVLFTDIVSSTEVATEVGDKRWRALVAAHHGLVRQALKRYHGRELDTAGDGFFASFPRPADAIRCACEVAEGVRQLGLEIRAGVHLGEAEIMGGKVGGLVVNTGARIMAIGTAGEVLVSTTVRESVAGKGIGFADHGVHQLKGLEGDYHVFVVTTLDERPVESPLDPSEARRRRELPPEIERPRRWRLVGAAAAAVVIAVVGGVLTWSGGEEEVARANDPPAEGPRALTDADEQLIRLVPGAFSPSCEATDLIPASAVAGVTCVDGDVTVRYEGYQSTDAVEDAFRLATAGADATGLSCRDDAAATGHYAVNGLDRGSVACWVDQELLSYRSSIVWSDETLLVFGIATREDLTDFRGSVPDLSLYEWWSEEAGPTDTGAVSPKDAPIVVPEGTYRIEITDDEVGSQSDGKVDPIFAGVTTLTLEGSTATVTYADGGVSQSDLLWGKGNRLIFRARGALGDDFTGQCPRFESLRWKLAGDRLILSAASPEVNCNALREFLTAEPLERVAG